MPSPAKKQPDRAVAGSSRSRRAMPKKPKFLSLRRIELSTTLADAMASHRCYQRRKRRARQQPNTSPLQPDIPNDEDAKDAQNVYEDNVNVTLLFNEDDESATTLSGILDGGDTAAVACSEEGSVGSRDSARGMADSVDYGGGNHHHRSSLLVRAAMKCVGRDKEEKWVSYDEVVERKLPPSDYEPEEVSSCSAVDNYCECSDGQDWWLWHPMGKGDRSGGPLLKLDYEDVLNSWSYEGPLFIGGDGGALLHHKHEAPQVVPELTSEFPGTDTGTNDVKSDTMEGSANLWTVPEHKGDCADSMSEDKFRLREASVLRYKEKRQNRLFSKRIRYEVRRLNAEKRPRVKGRFVRRNGEDD